MENLLGRASQAVLKLSAVLEEYSEAQVALRELENYYGSNEWKQDFADEEAGRLPTDMNRGVLSEDAIWNLLEDNREIKVRIMDILSYNKNK